MKILLILTLIAVLTVDCRDFQDQPGNSDEATCQDQSGEERTAYGVEAAYGYNYYSTELQDVKEQKSIELQRGKRAHRHDTLSNSCAGVIESKIQNLEETVFKLKSNMNDLEGKIDARSCTTGFFNVGDQCFKFFIDVARSWLIAKSKCQEEGLQQAKPNDPVTLRKYIIDNFGDDYVAWLGARGDNTALKWDRNGMKIGNSDPLWWTSHPGDRVTTRFCLALLSDSNSMKQQPTQPFIVNLCNLYPSRYALCEG